MILNLDRRVREWHDAAIIDAATLERIRAHEACREGHAWVGFGIAAVGVVALLTGIISIVAANWDFLSDNVKLAGYFSLQILVGVLFVRAESKLGIWREMVLIIFASLFLAGIALVGQVYNLSGPWWQTLLFWLLLALPPACAAHSYVLPFLWSLTILVTSVVWSIEASGWSELERVGCTLTSPFVLISASLLSTRLGVLRQEFRKALIVSGIGALLLPGALWADFTWNFGSFGVAPGKPYLLLPSIGALASAALSLARPAVPLSLRATTACLLLFAAAYLTAPLLLAPASLLPEPLGELLGALGFIALWALAAAAAVMASMRRLFNVASFAIAVRVVVTYFQVFGTLTATGLGLIISGLVIISVGLLWNRGRKIVNNLLKGAI